MPLSTPTMAERIALAVMVFQQQLTGHKPNAVTVVLSGETLVVTLHGALSPAEQAAAQNPDGAATVQEYHRELFHSASDTLRQDIKRITGMSVRQAAAQVATTAGAVVQAFTNGTTVQVFQLSGKVPPGSFHSGDKT